MSAVLTTFLGNLSAIDHAATQFMCSTTLSPLQYLQIAGFAAVFALFLACGLAFYSLTATTQALQGFQAMYYISSFFAQFVNATTFLLVSSHLPREFIFSLYNL